MALLLFGLSTAILIASTVAVGIRTRFTVSGPLLVGTAWLGLMPLQIVLRPLGVTTAFWPAGFHGGPLDTLYLATTMASLTLVAYQQLSVAPAFAGLASRIDLRLSPPSSRADPLPYWFAGLLAVGVGLALIHLALMPRIPIVELFRGAGSDQLVSDRENAAKLLHAPALLKYMFTWDSRLLLPAALIVAVLKGWRRIAIAVGAFALFYIAAPMEKFPSMLLVLGPFLAVAMRGRKPVYSGLVVAGLLISLVPPFALAEAPHVSASLRARLHLAVPTPAPADGSGAGVPGAPVPSNDLPFSARRAPLELKDLVLRRIGAEPADVSYAWFAYFPAVHPYLNLTGWEPWKVLSSRYQPPANLVGQWAYYGQHGYRNSSINAYGSFIADGWAQLGYIGVLLACGAVLAFGLVLELFKNMLGRPFCLALYVPAMLIFATVLPQGGIMAIAFSLGLSLCPLLCLGYLLHARRSRPGRDLDAGGPS